MLLPCSTTVAELHPGSPGGVGEAVASGGEPDDDDERGSQETASQSGAMLSMAAAYVNINRK